MDCHIKLERLLQSMRENGQEKKAENLDKWIIKYTKYLSEEKSFQEGNHMVYSRGQVLKVEFGYNIGQELGGVHYAIVLSKYDSPRSTTVIVLPLSSIKPGKPINKRYEYDIGKEMVESIENETKKQFEKVLQQKEEVDEITGKLTKKKFDMRRNGLEEVIHAICSIDVSKLKRYNQHITRSMEFKRINEGFHLYKSQTSEPITQFVNLKDLDGFLTNITIITDDVHSSIEDAEAKLGNTLNELHRLKIDGSRVLLGQIKTIGKQRIIFPVYKNDALEGVRIKKETMDGLCCKLSELIGINDL